MNKPPLTSGGPKTHKIYCPGDSATALRSFAGFVDLEQYFKTLPVETFPPGGRSFEVHFSNGVYECTVEIGEKAGADKPEFKKLLSCKSKTARPKTIPLHFQDTVFPGEKEITAFLALYLTRSYKIGTVFEIHFSDGMYICALGILSCIQKENNVGTLTPGTSETIAHILEGEPKI